MEVMYGSPYRYLLLVIMGHFKKVSTNNSRSVTSPVSYTHLDVYKRQPLVSYKAVSQ